MHLFVAFHSLMCSYDSTIKNPNSRIVNGRMGLRGLRVPNLKQRAHFITRSALISISRMLFVSVRREVKEEEWLQRRRWETQRVERSGRKSDYRGRWETQHVERSGGGRVLQSSRLDSVSIEVRGGRWIQMRTLQDRGLPLQSLQQEENHVETEWVERSREGRVSTELKGRLTGYKDRGIPLQMSVRVSLFLCKWFLFD